MMFMSHCNSLTVTTSVWFNANPTLQPRVLTFATRVYALGSTQRFYNRGFWVGMWPPQPQNFSAAVNSTVSLAGAPKIVGLPILILVKWSSPLLVELS